MVDSGSNTQWLHLREFLMILSVSRRTDIPAFFSEWFFNRVKTGFLMVRNPMNYHQVSKIPLDRSSVDCFVFWTKNPAAMLVNLHFIEEYYYYFLFTITSYDDSVETNVPRKSAVIDTFKRLSDTIGSHRVIWRYDPILLSDTITEQYHYKYFEYIASKLNGYTNKCVISFLDSYKKCQNNLKNLGLVPICNEDMLRISRRLCDIAKSFNITVSSCAEEADLQSAGVSCNKCIDPDLIKELAAQPLVVPKDKTQRNSCGCVASIDVGTYNTCHHNCLYCYANFSFNSVINNTQKHNPDSPFLIGELENTDKVTLRKMESCFNRQSRLSY